jgi:hypothetical protein
MKICPLCLADREVVKIKNLDGLEFGECKACGCRAPADAWDNRAGALVPRELANRVADDCIDNCGFLQTKCAKKQFDKHQAQIEEARRLRSLLDKQA